MMHVLPIQLVSGSIIFMLFSVCGAASDITGESTRPVACTDPRPQLCTQEYSPVCGERFTDIQCVTTPCQSSQTSEQKEYANACMACADKEVISYMPGRCKQTDN